MNKANFDNDERILKLGQIENDIILAFNVSEEHIKLIKNLRQTPAVPAFKPASATIEEEQFNDDEHICGGTEC